MTKHDLFPAIHQYQHRMVVIGNTFYDQLITEMNARSIEKVEKGWGMIGDPGKKTAQIFYCGGEREGSSTSEAAFGIRNGVAMRIEAGMVGHDFLLRARG